LKRIVLHLFELHRRVNFVARAALHSAPSTPRDPWLPAAFEQVLPMHAAPIATLCTRSLVAFVWLAGIAALHHFCTLKKKKKKKSMPHDFFYFLLRR
jgi:hypothetical protein